MHTKRLLPSIWGTLNNFPSFFEEDVIALSNDRGLSVSENNGKVLIEAAVPGLKLEDIEISLDKGTLWIKGKKTEEKEDKERKYYQKASSSYSYCTSLPETTDLDSEPEACYEHGIVKISFKKKDSSKPKKIEIKKK